MLLPALENKNSNSNLSDRLFGACRFMVGLQQCKMYLFALHGTYHNILFSELVDKLKLGIYTYR